jgi:4-amino-4-deoxy-L-arabinose transferase-like glycosyltransferase
MGTSGDGVRDKATTSTPWAAVAAGIAMVVAFRIPAFLEPHWYSDESVYAYVGRTVFGGGDLYVSPGAWDNKPPVQYWIYGIVTHFLGYSEAAIHLVPFASAIAVVIAVGWGVARLSGSRLRAGVACVLAALIIGPPLFDSELFLPEGALIGLTTWAGMLMLVHIASPRWAARHRWAPYLAGFLASIALGMQQTVIADVAAIGIILLIACPSRWRDLLRFLGAGLAVTLLWLVPTIVASGIGPTWFATVAFYGIYAHNSLPLTLAARVVHFAGIAGGLIAIVLGAALIARRTRNSFWNRPPRRGIRPLSIPAPAAAINSVGVRGARGHAVASLGCAHDARSQAGAPPGLGRACGGRPPCFRRRLLRRLVLDQRSQPLDVLRRRLLRPGEQLRTNPVAGQLRERCRS